MTPIEHHADSMDLGEHGFIEATRDDTDELQDYHLIAWKNGLKTHEFRFIYNIQYDYFRRQEWWRGRLIWDYLTSNDGYGHLLYEFDYGLHGPEGWVPSMDENGWEPVTPLGAQMFREEGTSQSMILTENRVRAYACFYNLKYYEKWRLPARLLEVEIMDMNDRSDRERIESRRCAWRHFALYSRGRLCSKRPHPFWTTHSRRIRHQYDSGISQIDRLRFFKKQSEELRVEVPIDPRMVFTQLPSPAHERRVLDSSSF